MDVNLPKTGPVAWVLAALLAVAGVFAVVAVRSAARDALAAEESNKVVRAANEAKAQAEVDEALARVSEAWAKVGRARTDAHMAEEDANSRRQMNALKVREQAGRTEMVERDDQADADRKRAERDERARLDAEAERERRLGLARAEREERERAERVQAAAEARRRAAALGSFDEGVRAFRGRRLADARRHLSAAAQADPDDPVTWYFLAAVRFELGQGEQARADARRGGEAEAASSLTARQVGEALTPIQGPVRDEIERGRRAAGR